MWIVIEYNKNSLGILLKELKDRVGDQCKFYNPKIFTQKFYRNKLIKKEYHLLGNYLFFSHKFLEKNEQFIKSLVFLKGLKSVLTGYRSSQKEITQFIEKCKSFENSEGVICQSIYKEIVDKKYIFNSGPFTGKIFKKN